jgi:hypothetical protein
MQISFLRFDAGNMTVKIGTLSDSRERLNIINEDLSGIAWLQVFLPDE